MSLPTPRYVISETDPTVVQDRWEEAGSKAGYGFNSEADARQYARDEDCKFTSMLIVFTPPEGKGTEIISIVPISFSYETGWTSGSTRARKEAGFYLRAIDLANGIPGDKETWYEDYPVDNIVAWDV